MEIQLKIKNKFFKPTQLYKEFLILDLIKQNKNITQREISNHIGIAVSSVNSNLDIFLKANLILKKKYSSKNIEYKLTKKGIEKRKLLNIWFFKSSLRVYQNATNNILYYLKKLTILNDNKILLYGAGDVAEIIIRVLKDKNIDNSIDVVAVIDDDKNKQGKMITNIPIISIDQIKNYFHKLVLVSSYTHRFDIIDNLKKTNYPMDFVINFFE